MIIDVELTPHLCDTLNDFRKQHAEYQRTTSSTPALELNKCYSALSTSALILAEALDKAAKASGA